MILIEFRESSEVVIVTQYKPIQRKVIHQRIHVHIDTNRNK